MSSSVLRWGFCSAGMIANDFSLAMDLILNEGHKKIAVAARDATRAAAFASKHGFVRSYDSYDALAEDAEVDIVYVGSIAPQHEACVKVFLEKGKHVLCEKPLTPSAAATRALVDLARKQGVFFMEGLWTRFFPAYREVARIVNDGEIGPVSQIFSHFHFSHAMERMLKPELGGGACLDLGTYVLNVPDMIYGERPEKVMATGTRDPTYGVDDDISMVFKYPGNRIATCSASFNAGRPSTATICGKKGYIIISHPIWCSIQITKGKTDENGFPVENPEVMDFPLLPQEGYSYMHGSGFVYEQRHIKECIDKGLKESPIMPLEASIRIAENRDKALAQF